MVSDVCCCCCFRRLVVPNLGYVYPWGYVRKLKGYARFEFYAVHVLSNIYFLKPPSGTEFYIYVWGYVITKKVVNRWDYQTFSPLPSTLEDDLKKLKKTLSARTYLSSSYQSFASMTSFLKEELTFFEEFYLLYILNPTKLFSSLMLNFALFCY